MNLTTMLANKTIDIIGKDSSISNHQICVRCTDGSQFRIAWCDSDGNELADSIPFFAGDNSTGERPNGIFLHNILRGKTIRAVGKNETRLVLIATDGTEGHIGWYAGSDDKREIPGNPVLVAQDVVVVLPQLEMGYGGVGSLH